MKLDRATIALLLAALLTTSVASCRGPEVLAPPPLVAPRLAARVVHFAGSPVSGPVAAAEAVDPGRPEDALQTVVTFYALERMPEGILDPLGLRARLLVSDEGGAAIRPAAMLLGGARVGALADVRTFTAGIEGGALGRSARIVELRGVLPPGITAAFELARGLADGGRASADATERGDDPRPGTPPRRARLRVSLRRVEVLGKGQGLEGAVEVEVEPASTASGPRRPRRELIVGEPFPLKGRLDMALIFPCDLEGEETRAIAAVWSIASPPAPEGIGASAHRAALAACRADLAEQVARLSEPPAPRPSPLAAPPDLETARRSLLDPRSGRRALFSIAQGTGARLAEDIALSADEPLLATVTTAVATALATGYAGKRGPDPDWAVERATIAVLFARSRSADDVTPADLFLLRRIGGIVWAEDVADGVLAATTDLADLDARLVAANKGLLDDPQPELRARAYDWLDARGEAPEGYDPIGPSDARRKALEKAGIAARGGGT